MNPAERQEYQNREIAKLQRLCKGDYLERREDARRLVREVELSSLMLWIGSRRLVAEHLRNSHADRGARAA